MRGKMVVIFLLLVFLWLALEMGIRGESVLDAPLMRGEGDKAHPLWVRYFLLFSWLGNSVVFAGALLLGVVLLGFARRPGEALVLIVSLAGAWGANEGLKMLFARTRPDWGALIAADGYSFPSGSAMVAVAFYGMAAYLLCQRIRSGRLSSAVVAIIAFLILMIGIGRVYLGVHYPSDILAGFALGGVWLLAMMALLRKYGSDRITRKTLRDNRILLRTDRNLSRRRDILHKGRKDIRLPKHPADRWQADRTGQEE